MDTLQIMIVGVGGQGTLLASRILGKAFISQGMDVKVSEVHGMSQRGGSVVTYVKCGKKVDSPIVDRGNADMIMAFEQLEAARFLPYLKPGGKMIVNTQQIDPMPVITGTGVYPDNIVQQLQSVANVVSIDALSLAKQAGSAKAVNVVLIGAMVKRMGLDKEVYLKAVETTVPAKFKELNIKAFEMGYNA